MSVSNLPAVLILEDGTTFRGTAFGKKGTATGEICFNTGMTGYQEVFTDPSYYGQILIMNNVHIGNYGVKAVDVESDSVKVRGVIGRNLEEKYSRFMADNSLQDYFEAQGVVAIDGVDTRALVAHIRTQGAMNCIISSENTDIESLKAELKKVPSMDGLELASTVSTGESYFLGDEKSDIRVAVLDFGIKKNILNCLVERGAYVKVHNAKTSFGELEQFKPHGYFISNGPGDPAPMDYAIKTVKQIIASGKPLFGICLGHQLLALANDIPTFKMHHGHRGLNHPVKNVISGHCEITTQNHGFGVDPASVRANPNIEITHVNLNDESIEGIRMKNKPAFSVQYHPEATPGPHDSRYLFDQFIGMIKN
ncbi:MAG TPA: glutamine-hydrolyzing carbamoyl-phosphate synthase small subunit [Ferruginibacter sp.]|jgi:carbamoyl-phosphate synthase small subunit|nr:glutamine-hydrolyzing carbamoyl-phosphate synthase small subunit [Ferruginibacter sp.]MBN8699922.1 glutamine-hydrolyzing carbamoyl-phosphate synthase small subunit [Chitinophagales bacterium]HMX35849.1 glutamine-hydrolyzing carbamoyl-phosphate synthase small subunit [Ferruginibacter sp.]HMX79813.1 glutamine-hydrolyzing carbamoyl-phosphate synthase small subunit [Ferruginibacter sp.]HMZ99414.1 glutamine-hydrolyzing carbamoyl-phosphate synthase small subunit [Ferruginibacter sp.]